MSNIYIDLEAIPSQEGWVKDSIKVKPPSNIKKQESIDKWYSEKADEAFNSSYEKTVFDGTTNHIICIGVAIDDQEPAMFYANQTGEEFNMLGQFYHYLSKNADSYGNVVIGHNVVGFDINVIRKRSIILGVEPTFKLPFNAKPWGEDVYDTMVKWDAKSFTSQDKLCQALGIEGKGDMDGSMVYGYWKDGRHSEIEDYCKSDVKTVRKIYKKMKVVC